MTPSDSHALLVSQQVYWTNGELMLLQMATPAVKWAESPHAFKCLQKETTILKAKGFVDSQSGEGGSDSTGR